MNVDKTFAYLTEVSTILAGVEQITLMAYVDESARKAILLGAASEFEFELCNVVRRFVAKAGKENEYISALVENKAISRQYHTWFNWKDRTENTFYGLFGTSFSERMKRLKKDDAAYAASVDAFMEIGQLRNQLVHGNFAAYYVEKTAAELFHSYRLGILFVKRVETEFDAICGS